MFGAWWITEKALASVNTIGTTARLSGLETGDEIARLTHVLNRRFDRLERTSRFSADASHELNTSLTIMRGRIERGASREGTATDTNPLLVDLLKETSRLSGIAEGLLPLAKAHAWQLDLDLSDVDFTRLVERTLEDVEILAAAKDIRLQRTLQPGVVLRADSGRLLRVLLNLLDNAVNYTYPAAALM